MLRALGLVVGLLCMWSCAERGPDASSPRAGAEVDMDSGVYVFQRAWTSRVRDAVRERSGEFDEVICLIGELGYRDSEFYEEARVDAAREFSSHCLRIESGAVASKWSPEACERVGDWLAEFWDGREPERLQLDYDCPSSRLSEYRHLLLYLKERFPGVALEFTALPDWVGREEFRDLAELTGRYVIQVHGVSGHGPDGVLCDVAAARRVVETCGALGVEFRVALPTYAHAVLRDERGRVVKIASESGMEELGGKRVELAAADPNEMGELLAGWKKDRPAAMTGVIWYRMPVTGERMNWDWETLCAVRGGEELSQEPELSAVEQEEGLYELRLKRVYGLGGWPREVKVMVSGGVVAGADGLGGYSVERGATPQEWRWVPREMMFGRLPSEGVVLGWIRVATRAGERCEVTLK